MSGVTIFTDECLEPYMIVYENRNFRVIEKAKRNKKDGTKEDIVKDRGNYSSIDEAMKATARLLMEKKRGTKNAITLLQYIRAFKKIKSDIANVLKYVQ